MKTTQQKTIEQKTTQQKTTEQKTIQEKTTQKKHAWQKTPQQKTAQQKTTQQKTTQQKATLVCLRDVHSPVAEAYRTLRTNIQFSAICSELKALMVTSAGPGEGKTTTIANLAVAFAQTGLKVVLIDGDLRKPGVHRIFNIANLKGLSNILVDDAPFETVIQHIPGVNLDIITAGDVVPNHAELLASPQIQELVRQLRISYDMVLIDSPPILPVTDAQLLARYVDGVLLVVRSGTVAEKDIKKAKGLLDIVGARVIGTVLNKKKTGKKSYYDYYS